MPQLRIYGTLEEQLARCNRDIEDCARKLEDPDYPDHEGASIGWLDWVRNRELVLKEMRMQTQRAA